MKKFIALALIISSIFISSTAIKADTTAKNPPEINAEAGILMDAATGEILVEKNPNERLAMASTTKIMTAIVALDKGKLDDQVTVTQTIMDRNSVYGTLIYLEPGEKFTLKDLIYAAMLNSANDAATAVAEHVGGNVANFAKMMNEKAKELGATNTNFLNPHGLTQQGHYSSAKDLALFARYGLQNPVFAQIVRTKQAEIPRSKPELPKELNNINHMLWLYNGADGVKTGYTSEAGNCVVESATRDGRQLIVVLLKSTASKGIYKDTENLFNYGFDNYENKQIVGKGNVVDSVLLSNSSVMRLVVTKDVYAAVRRGDQDKIELKPKVTSLKLPVQKGETRGELQILKQGKLIESVPLVAADKIAAPPVLSQIQVKGNFYFEGLSLLILTIILIGITNRIRTRKRKRSLARTRSYGYYRD